ncbi:putative CDC23 protein [Sordaria macrospora k-hell]|uniref:Putative CDC23 protein n=1 Tax=Sordaria macrospora (strain ATCC MYA-333 / DSM 997 / K(L3346) / K-hell) TaxID=771870 RepID=F7VTU2_SORMK|nr:putative CDC23 protein [Sordaria macrospora k-hell]CCC08930.1 putative CDC23 protein [Sordaria macrospora k-hell]
MRLSAIDTLHLKEALQNAVVKCSERCLYQSAKWAAELLDSVPDPVLSDVDQEDAAGLRGYQHPAFSSNPDPVEAELEAKDLSKYLLAKSFFDCKEFDRCASVFLPDSLLSGLLSTKANDPATPKGKGKASAALPFEQSLPNLSQKSLFLALYAKVISGEKKKNEESEMIMGPQDLGTIKNSHLVIVSRFLERWFAERKAEDSDLPPSQGFLEYLYGMVLVKEKNDDAAFDYLLNSVHLFPWNWGAWLELTNLIPGVEQLNKITPVLPQNIMSFIFYANTAVNLYQQGQDLAASVNDLLKLFPTSSFILTCRALLNYHSKDLYTAEQNFSNLLALHPHRLDSLDHYSNILYVLNMRPKLAFLAHLCSSIDKFRPESCVVIGNYYSLLSFHEKAVQYFRRALTLDRSCLSAWTLMGHEYVELKNTHAAIESYRRAVDVNRRDYRAWYGLGQTYEVLEMNAYALYYYKKAAGLRPWDGKMWQAVGSCLQKMGKDRDGIKALKRALLADSYYDSTLSSFGSSGPADRMAQMDPEVLLQIATMYDRLGEVDEARAYMELCVAQEDGGATENVDTSAVGTSNPGESFVVHGDSPGSDGDAEGGYEGRGGAGQVEGTGVTVATSKARMWLARYAMKTEDYVTANRLATELCQDGVEVEEAKALIREYLPSAARISIGSNGGGAPRLRRVPRSGRYHEYVGPVPAMTDHGSGIYEDRSQESDGDENGANGRYDDWFDQDYLADGYDDDDLDDDDDDNNGGAPTNV